MARGDGGKAVFESDEDRKGFLFRVGRICASRFLRQRTSAGNPWITKRLAMGHSGSVSRLVVAAMKDRSTIRELEKLVKMLECDT